MKGFKAFEKGLICRGFKFKEGKVYKEKEAVIYKKGFHFCKNPLDVLDYYPLIYDNGNLTEFAEVEALDEALTDDNKKFCTKKIKIGNKLSLNDFINASVEFIKESCESENTASGYSSQLAASGYRSKLAASGYGSIITLNGANSVGANIGVGGIIKGKKGCWITLAEYDQDGKPICVKSAQIDGKRIKADTLYKLKNGEFVEVKEEE